MVSQNHLWLGGDLDILEHQKILLNQLIKCKGQTTSANCSIAQRAGISALRAGNESATHMKESYLKRRDIVFEKLNEISHLNVNLPEGAFYFFRN